LVHPVTRSAFFGAAKRYALKLESPANEEIKVGAADKGVSPHGAGRQVDEAEFKANALENFHGKKRDLPLVIFLVIKKAIALDSAPREAPRLDDLHHRMIARLASMAKEIVAGRQVKMLDAHAVGNGHRFLLSIAK
jgi:hypothetical protein